MSYQIQITGHANPETNDEVVEIAEEATRKLQALPGASEVTLTGYAYNGATRRDLATPPVAESA